MEKVMFRLMEARWRNELCGYLKEEHLSVP